MTHKIPGRFTVLFLLILLFCFESYAGGRRKILTIEDSFKKVRLVGNHWLDNTKILTIEDSFGKKRIDWKQIYEKAKEEVALKKEKK